MEQWGSSSAAPIWAAPPPPAPLVRRRGSGWAIGGIVVASAGFVTAAIGAMLGLVTLLGSGLIYAASQGKAGGTHAFVELTRIGDLYLVMPLTLIAAVCTVLAWRDPRGPERTRATTIVATAMTGTLALLALGTTLVFI